VDLPTLALVALSVMLAGLMAMGLAAGLRRLSD
jgi:hypothetical protein